MAACRSCGAAIRWERTTSGGLMPLNRTPDPRGNVIITDGGATVVAHPDEQTLLPPETREERYMSHFATCPDAARHRRS